MKAEKIFEMVVEPNYQSFWAETSSLRHAVNFLLAYDSFIGNLALGQGVGEKAFRNGIAERHEPYALCRDMAFSLKHGELNWETATPRLVQTSSSLKTQQSKWDDRGYWRTDMDWSGTGETVFIEMENDRFALVVCAKSIMEIVPALLKNDTIPEVNLASIRWVLN